MLRKQATKHPIVFGIIAILVFQIVMQTVATLVVLFAPRFFVNNGDYVYQGTVECFVALAGIGLVALFGYNGIWGEKGKGFFKGLGIGGYFIFVQIVALFGGLSSIATIQTESGTLTLMPVWKIAAYIICFFLVGFAEEVFFRGLISNFFFDKHAKDPAGVWTAALWSGLLFGLMHMVNILGAFKPEGLDISYVSSIIVQVISTIVMGMAFTAVYYRCRNIWVVIILHAMNNICAGIASGFFEGASLSDTLGAYPPIMAVTGSIPYLMVTIILLRPKKLKEIIKPDYNDCSTPEERIAQYSKSKRSKALAVVITLLICIALLLTSVALSWDGTIKSILGDMAPYSLEYSVYETWSGEDYFTATEEFVSAYSGEHDLTIMSYPGDSKAMLKLTVSDDAGNVIFTESYGGRCSDAVVLTLEEGVAYTVTMEYDYSLVTDGSSVDYTTMIIIE